MARCGRPTTYRHVGHQRGTCIADGCAPGASSVTLQPVAMSLKRGTMPCFAATVESRRNPGPLPNVWRLVSSRQNRLKTA